MEVGLEAGVDVFDDIVGVAIAEAFPELCDSKGG